MSRPSPLTNLASARPSPGGYQVLTPRTPHSRSGRAEEGYTEFELQRITENDDDDLARNQHQSVPLLSSSASDSFPIQNTGYRSRGDDYDPSRNWDKRGKGKGRLMVVNTVLSNLPLVLGSMVAAFLLFLLFMSYSRPEKLHKYLGISQTNSTNSTTATHHIGSTSLDPKLLISYENYTTFPLHAPEYLKECHKLNQGYMSHGGYWEPHEMGVMDVVHADDEMGERVCTATITYMLDGTVGLLADLALLVQTAALARERNRTLLIDDTYWNRGKWTDHFADVRDTQPGPEPGCKAPPPEELVACPRLARHWVVNSRTSKYHFGHAFSENYENAYGHNLNRLKPVFKFSETSLLTTIQPSKENTLLIHRAKAEMSTLSSPDGTMFSSYIAIHLRRGDRNPAFYRGDYVPAENFIQAAADSWSRLNPEESPESLTIYIASDSIAAHREVMDLTASRYATYSLFESEDPQLRALASPGDYLQKEFDQLSESHRIRATRGMIVDFALLTGLWTDIRPQATVCTISSNVCKLAAVGLGWDTAFGDVDDMGTIDKDHKRWVEIDQGGAILPVWLPFELF